MVGDSPSDSEARRCVNFLLDEDTLRDTIPVGAHSPISRWEVVTTELGGTNVVYRQDGSSHYFKNLRELFEVFNRRDLFSLDKCTELELMGRKARGFEVMLWGYFQLMMNSKADDDSSFWKTQTTWKITRWKLFPFCGVHLLEASNGIDVYMLTDKRYPLTSYVIEKLLKLKLEVDPSS